MVLSMLNFQVNAKECDVETRTNAANVTASYEMRQVIIDAYGNVHPEISIEKGEDTEDGYAVNDVVDLVIQNMTDRIYVTVFNKTDNIKETYDYSDSTNGKIVINVLDTEKIREYEIKVYSNVAECYNEELRTITVNTPMYNKYYDLGICNNNDVYYCRQQYVTADLNIDEDKIYDEYYAKKNENQASENESNETKSFWSQNKNWLTIGGVVVIVGLVSAIMYMILKKSKKGIK